MTYDGLSRLSTATSDGSSGLGDFDEDVNSPDLRNPKKPVQHAAQSMTLLNDTGGPAQHW